MKEEVKNGIIITVTIILILIVVYLTTAFFMTGEIGSNKNNTSTTTTTTISSSGYKNTIIAGATFKQTPSEYLVMFFSQSKVSEGLKSVLKAYDSASKETKLYKVNVDEAINKYVLSNEENAQATNSKELQTKGTVLIRIKNGVINSYITDENEIINELK